MRRMAYSVLIVVSLFTNFTEIEAKDFEPISVAKTQQVPDQVSLPNREQLQTDRVNLRSDSEGNFLVVSEFSLRDSRYYLEVGSAFSEKTYCLHYPIKTEDNEINPYIEIVGGFGKGPSLVCLIAADETGITELFDAGGGIFVINIIRNSPEFLIKKVPR